MRSDDIEILQGSDWGRRYPIITTDGDPADLAGCSARAQIRSILGALLYTWEADAGNLVVNPGDSTITITVPHAESSAWTWPSGHWDMELTDSHGDVVRLVGGYVSVSREVTRDDTDG